MVKKKTTKEIRAIDGIIKFQIDDGIESLTISGKEALADLEIDNKNNVTLYLNADKDKINELHSLVPFINLEVNEYWEDPDKQKSVTLSQDLTQFALEIADNSKELASLIKSESSIILDLDGLVQKLLEIAGKLAELEAKDLEQDNRLTDIEAKNEIQDDRLDEIDVTQDAHASKLHSLEEKDIEQDNRLTDIEAKDVEQDNRLTELESNGQTGGQLYNVSTHTLVHTFSERVLSYDLHINEKGEKEQGVSPFGHVIFCHYDVIGMGIEDDFIQLPRLRPNKTTTKNGTYYEYYIRYDGLSISVKVMPKEESSFQGSVHIQSVLYKEIPDIYNEHDVEITEKDIRW